MLAVTLVGAAVAVASSRQITAALAVLGGLLTPLLLRVERPDERNLLVYLLVLDFLVLAIARFRSWPALNRLAWAGSALLLLPVFRYQPEPVNPLTRLVLLSGLFLLFVAVPLLRERAEYRRIGEVDFLLVVGNAAGYFWVVLRHARCLASPGRRTLCAGAGRHLPRGRRRLRGPRARRSGHRGPARGPRVDLSHHRDPPRPRRPLGDARVGRPGCDAALGRGRSHDAGRGLGWPRRAALRRGPRGVPRSLLVPRRDARLEPDLSRPPPGGRRADRGGRAPAGCAHLGSGRRRGHGSRARSGRWPRSCSPGSSGASRAASGPLSC